MSKINLLDASTISKIAAGEIIENPASIVKELVENSIDAKSKNITVEIENGGIDFLRITDDGTGIENEYLPLAFMRHATSKIMTIEDLYETYSLGFRGEALASIASAAKVEIITKTHDSEVGVNAVINADGSIAEETEVGALSGTTIIVRELFYNLPVRRKFLKNSNYEANAISTILTKLALSHPEISFKYIRDGKIQFATNSEQTYVNNLYQLLGKSIARNLHNISYSDELLCINGYVSDNILYRSSRSHQYMFINNRTIKSSELTYNIERAYQSYIPLNRYPVFVLYIDISPALIDVNIHPSKEEIKFINEINAQISDTVNKVLREKIKEITRIPERLIEEKEENIFSRYSKTQVSDTKSEVNVIDWTKPTEVKEEAKPYLFDTLDSLVLVEDEVDETPIFKSDAHEDNVQESIIEEEAKPQSLFSDYAKYIGTLFNTYILIEEPIKEKYYFIDQHAAHERILYERFKSEFESDAVHTQLLMDTEVVYLSQLEVEILESTADDLKQLGIAYDSFGDNSIVIREVPIFLKNIRVEQLLKDIIDASEKIDNVYHVDLYKIMKIACIHAVKSGDKLSAIEVDVLLKDLAACENPLSCPHGRPTVIEYNKAWLDKEFFRIQN